jgi:cation-transporting ATPase I
VRLAAFGAVGGLGPALVRTSARTSWGLTRAGGSAGSRAARVAASAALSAPAAVARAATALLVPDCTRRVWSAGGRAQLQVWGLDGPECPAVVAGVQQALAGLDGVCWARVDAVTRRAVVRFDPTRVATGQLADAVGAAERAAGVDCPGYPPDEASFPGDTEPVRLQGWALAADTAGLSAAVAGRLAGLPSLPGGAAAAVVLVDNQPRLRVLLESRLGPAATDLALAVSTAAVQALTQGVPSLLVDTAQRTQAVLAARARRDGFTRREAELAAPDRPVRGAPLARVARPVPLPPGPVERHADRAAAGSLLAAGGLLAATGNADLAGRVLLIGAPKAARSGREAFADTLTAGLSRRGVVVGDPAALRRLDRVDTVVVDSTVLHDDRALVLSALPLSGAWTTEHVWGAAQRLLAGGDDLPLPPPRGRHRHRLALLERAEPHQDTGLSLQVLTEDGTPVGQVLVGTELDPYADAVLSAGQAAGLRLVLTSDPAAPELAGRADEVLAGGKDGKGLAGQVRRLQAAGRVVALVSAQEDALAAADVGIGVVPAVGRVPWAADVLCGPGLGEVPRLLAAVPAARAVSARGVTSATAATFLGALLSAVGGPARTARAVLPVTAAAGVALLSGTMTARQVLRLPPPEAVLHTPWHALEPDEVLTRLPRPAAGTATPTVPSGRGRVVLGLLGFPAAALSPVSALARNVRAELADPLTPVLATGAAASAVIGSPTDALLVGGVLAANALVSGTQRLRADQALRALLLDQQLPARLVDTAESLPAAGHLVGSEAAGGRRAGQHDGAADLARGVARTVPASGLRPGQVIDLQSGDVVPADARLLAAAGLEVDEASLTGESAAVDKQTQATPGAELADRVCMVYEGTAVLAGSARAVVVAVGSATEAGRALTLAGRAGAPAGMQARLEQLTRRGLPVTLLGGAGVTGLALLRRQPLPRAISSGVSVAVAAVPEGLPLVATVAQLGAARRLSARGVLVRSPRTLEALGRVDTVCFDKTGTLTEGRLRLARLAGLDEQWDPADPQGRRVLRAAARACPQPQDTQPVAHATDRAILDAAAQHLPAGLADEDWTELSELPFQSERGFSAALGRTTGKVRLVVKGAPEVLLPRCTHQRDDTGKRPLDGAGREQAQQMVHALAGRGLRVLAVARRNVTDVLPAADEGSAAEGSADGVDPEQLAEDLTLLGFVALADIPRPQAAPTIAALHTAGLATVMITGDHPVTAQAIAAGLGIPIGRVVTGPELAGLDDAARTRLVAKASVFARVSPEQKLRIIAALQHAGRVVAMTGDGANDAAAIRLADVGIGMAAHGSTSARSAADLVLTDPDVSLILDALVEGRAMWSRVRDAVAILLGGNAGEVGFTLAGTALAGRAPIGTRQFLLVNMLTDLLPSMAIALASTPSDPVERRDVLAGGVPSLGGPLLRDIAIRGTTTGAGALAAWQLGRLTGTRRRASTIALAALVGTQLGQTLLAGGRNPLVLATGVGSAAVLAGIIQTPGLSQFFGCTPLGPLAWATATGCAAGATLLAAAAPHLLPAAPGPDGSSTTVDTEHGTVAPGRPALPATVRP